MATKRRVSDYDNMKPPRKTVAKTRDRKPAKKTILPETPMRPTVAADDVLPYLRGMLIDRRLASGRTQPYDVEYNVEYTYPGIDILRRCLLLASKDGAAFLIKTLADIGIPGAVAVKVH